MGGGAARRLIPVVVAAASLALPAAAQALPARGDRATIDIEFSETRPGVAAGLTYRFEIHAPDGGKPPALRRLVVGPPAGAIVDTSATERCTASDQELRVRGDAACPEASRLGEGSADLVVEGFGNQSFTQTAFNVDGGQFQTVKQGRVVQAVVRGVLTPEGLDARIPTCLTGGQPPEGCAEDQARLLRSELALPALTRDGRSYFTTPPDCPPSGRWRSAVVLTFGDGVTERVFPEQPCAAAGEEPAPAAECRSRRKIVFSALARVGLRSISAKLRGRRTRLDPRRPVLDLRGLPRGRYTVRVRAVTRSGRRVSFTRRYRTCSA
jgi:hypothetical protein